MTEGSALGLRSAWLVVIDMQNVFAAADSPWATPGFASIVDANRTLIDGFGDRVVFTRFVAPASPEGAWREYYREWSFALVPDTDPLYDLVADLPHDGHPVVSRTTFGKWDDKPSSLRDAIGDADTIVLTGVSTDCCVISTALAAADAGVAVVVAADACAGLSQTDHQRAVDAMALYAPLITISTTADVLAAL